MTDEELTQACFDRGWGIITLGGEEGPVYLNPTSQHVVRFANRAFYAERRSVLTENNRRIHELTEAVKEAARLLHDVLYEKGCSADPAITAWLSRDIVKASERK